MTDTGDVRDASVDEAERVSANSKVHSSAWQETLEEMWAIEEELQEEGWETIETAAGHTTPRGPDDGAPYWGLEHIVPDSDAEAIEAAVEGGDFPSYDVYRSTVQGRVFGVTVLLDPETDTAILIANQFPVQKAVALAEHTHEVGHVNTVVRFLDGTVVAQVRHEDPEKFFPRYQEFGSFAEEWTATVDDAGESENGAE